MIKYKAYLVKNFLPVESVEAESFDELKDGFWISQIFNVVPVSHGFLWVPPHKIDHIKKLEVTDEE